MPNYRLRIPAMLYVNVEAATPEGAIADIEGYLEDMYLTSGASGWTIQWSYDRPATVWPELTGAMVHRIVPDGVDGSYVPGSYLAMIRKAMKDGFPPDDEEDEENV